MSAKKAIKTQVNEFLGITRPWAGITIPPRYDLTDKGVYREESPIEGCEPVDVFICAPIWVQSFEVNDRGQWNANLEFIDRIGHLQAHSVALSRLYGSATAFATELGGLGLRLARSEVSSLSSYLSDFTSPVAEHERKKSEAEQIVDNVREFILKNEDRFQSGETFPVRSRAGYRDKANDWWVFTNSAMVEASGCHSAAKAARVLAKAGVLVKNDNRNQMKYPVAGGMRPLMYVLAGHILECDPLTLFATVASPETEAESQTVAAETRTTSASAPVATVATVGLQDPELWQENATNYLVTTTDGVMIDEVERDFAETCHHEAYEDTSHACDPEDELREYAEQAFGEGLLQHSERWSSGCRLPERQSAD